MYDFENRCSSLKQVTEKWCLVFFLMTASWLAATYFVSKSFKNFYENRTSTGIEVVRNSDASHFSLAFAIGRPGREPEREIPDSFSMKEYHPGAKLEDHQFDKNIN